MKKIITLMLIVFFLVTLLGLNVSAAIAVQVNVNTNRGLDISYPKDQIVKINTPFQLNLHVFNSSNGLIVDNSTTNCSLHLYQVNGSHRWIGNFNYDLEDKDFYLIIDKNNFTLEGSHAYEINCLAEEIGGFASGTYDVTQNGKARPEGIVKVIFFAFFIIILFGSLFSFLKILGHWKDLEVDILEFAQAIGIYLVIFAYQYLALTYLGDPVINNLMEIFVVVGAITHAFVPTAAFLASLILNPFRKGARE